MKLLRQKALISYNQLIVWLITFLGFSSSCTKDNGGGEVIVEYGVPSAKFIVKGTITSSTTQKAVKGLKVSIFDNNSLTCSDTTNADGTFEVSLIEFPENHRFPVKVEDIDGATNNSFASLDTAATFTNPVFTNGDSHWFQGETQQTLNLQVKPQSK
jgi:putative lipoprotein (rSAM/lipoprotein system)